MGRSPQSNLHPVWPHVPGPENQTGLKWRLAQNAKCILQSEDQNVWQFGQTYTKPLPAVCSRWRRKRPPSLAACLSWAWPSWLEQLASITSMCATQTPSPTSCPKSAHRQSEQAPSIKLYITTTVSRSLKKSSSVCILLFGLWLWEWLLGSLSGLLIIWRGITVSTHIFKCLNRLYVLFFFPPKNVRMQLHVKQNMF